MGMNVKKWDSNKGLIDDKDVFALKSVFSQMKAKIFFLKHNLS